MIDWAQLFLLELIIMRMTGFVIFNPIWGRSNVPALVKAGLILMMALSAYGMAGDMQVELPTTVISFAVPLFMELAAGFALSFVLRLFLSIVQMGGEFIDTQMGLTMAQIYDPSSQVNMTVTGSLLNVLVILNFFAENGHYTLLRMLITSGELLPYGSATLGQSVASLVADLFLSCLVLTVKLSLPILAAEMLGEIGMGILMKAIPQINAFVINMELKVIIGLGLLFLFLTPINEFLLEMEVQMLAQVRQVLQVIAGA